MFALNPLLLVCYKKQIKKVELGYNLTGVVLYQSYGLNLPLHGAEGVALLFCSQIHWPAPKIGARLSCLKSLGDFYFCDRRTNCVRDCLPKIAAKKESNHFHLFLFILLHILDTLLQIHGFPLLLFLTQSFPPSSSLAINFLSHLNCRTFK